MARSTARNKKSTGLKVDFTGVESSGNVAEGRHLLTVDGAPEVKTSENSGNDYINWKFKAPGGVIYHTTSLQPQALWNLRNVLESLGLEVPEGPLDLDLAEMDGLTCGGEVEHESYQGKKRPRLVDIFPEEELEESEEEEEETKPAAKGKKKADPEPEEEETELPTYAEVQEADKDDLIELAEEHDVKLTVKQKKNVQAMRDAICAALELEEEEEEGSEEGDEPTYESVQEMDKEELLELAKENEIKVSLKLKKDLDGLRDFICEQLELEEEEAAPAPAKKGSRKAGSSAEIKAKSKVTFVDDGQDMEGVVKSVNAKDKFAVVLVDGEEWEVELDDLKLA